jgi:hypothetical protein
MKIFNLSFIVTLIFLLVNISGAFAEFGETYTNSDLEKYKNYPAEEMGVFTNSDLKTYEGRYKPVRKEPDISNWRGELSYVCQKSSESRYLSDEKLNDMIKKSDSLRSVIDQISMAASQKYTFLITLENCRQSLLLEAQEREKNYEIARAERLLRQELDQKNLSEQEALERLTAHKIRHSYDRTRALQIRFCDYRQDTHASYISCGHKLRQDGHPYTAMKLKQQMDSCLNPDTCFYTTERQVEAN